MLPTSIKILIARYLSMFVLVLRRMLGLPHEVYVTRKGIQWHLNLKEGIDFAIYLFGGFEIKTLARYKQLIRDGDVVLDIGANIGAHTLPLANLVGKTGRVIAFEPTAYAFIKLRENISLNPKISNRINAFQIMLMAADDEELPSAVYSSWPLEIYQDLHEDHCGRLMNTMGAKLTTVDSFLRENEIKQVNFIKIDVDGNDADVLLGAEQTIKLQRPNVLIELAPYVYKGCPKKFDSILEFFWSMGYEILDVITYKPLPKSLLEVRQYIPYKSSLNVLAIYKN